MIYVVEVMGWMTIVEATSKRNALSIARARASSASLLRSDVNENHIRPATADDRAWYRAMQFPLETAVGE